MNYRTYFIYIAMLMGVGLGACERLTNLDLLDDPNSVSPEKADIELLYNTVQQGFNGFVNSTFGFTAPLVRMTAMTSGNSYNNAFSATSFDGIWSSAYTGILADIQTLLVSTDSLGLDIHSGSAKIMRAYVLMSLVDLFGDVPYSEALMRFDNLSPVGDGGASVYAEAVGMLDEAILQLQNIPNTVNPPNIEIYYDGNPARWITLAKTLQLKAFVQTRLVDDEAGEKINALLAEGDLIDQMSEDLEFRYSTNRLNPNSRHPLYNDAYEFTDGIYLSNYYMWLLKGEKFVLDPRLRFYFYRQDLDLSNEDPNIWSCVFSDLPDISQRPDHYTAADPRMPYCIADREGYFGRDHGNDSGIPPDGNIRTVVGLYPAGGKFDDDSAILTQQGGTEGGRGEGITPIMLSSWVYFLRAEAALTLGTTDNAREMFEMGLRASFEKTFSFQSLVDGTEEIGQDINGNPRTVQSAFFDPLPFAENEYVDWLIGDFDLAPTTDAKMDILIKEYLIAAWGNGIEPYNNYRRTGKPENMQPTLQPAGGSFIRSALYPSNHVNLNANITQKENMAVQVFWDNNPADFID